jgi:hypothetical protein
VTPDRGINRKDALWQLREAEEELMRTIAAIERNPEYKLEEFEVAMQHLYHHLNTAWNTRSETSDRTASSSDEDFYRWRQFPSDLPMD